MERKAIDRRSPAMQEGPARWFGVYPAVVEDVKDPNSQGRVKVKLPFIPTSGDPYSAWARVATLMAGNDRGSFIVPDVDDEVLVSFQGGDVRFPFVVGALWNGKDAPPQSMDDKNNIRVLKTRSGHKLEFDDTDGKAKITLTTPGGCELILDDGSGGKVMLQHSSGSSIEFDASGGIKITANATLTLEAAMVQVNSSMSTFSGNTQQQTMIATTVVGSSYTPGAGNLW